MLLKLHTKNQNNPTRRFFLKLEKPHFEHILVPFCLKIAEQGFFGGDQPLSLFKIDEILTACKNQKLFTNKAGEKL